MSRVAPGDAETPVADRQRAVVEGDAPVAVYGLGKMGLPIAAVFAEVTGNVIGADVDPAVVDSVAAGDCPIEGEPGLPELVADLVERGELAATVDTTTAAELAALHVVVVPTTVLGDPGERRPDLEALGQAVEDVGAGLDPGDLVAVESTVPPGTCRDVVVPTLESASGLELGEFGVAFCPERTASGRALQDVRGAHPKVVGGVDGESERAATLVYETLVDNDVIPVGGATTAECVKVFEGVYRDVNIALANELATYARELDVDVRAAIEAANTQPYCDIHDPGPGVGGHCIPYYPWFLIEPLATASPLLRTARAVNQRMPAFTVDLLADALGGVEGATVVVLGVTYRPGVAETRESPAYPIATRLSGDGASVYAVDPMLDAAPDLDATLVDLDEVARVDPDAVVLVTPHAAFESVDWTALDDLVVVDGRDALDLSDTDHQVHTIGRK